MAGQEENGQQHQNNEDHQQESSSATAAVDTTTDAATTAGGATTSTAAATVASGGGGATAAATPQKQRANADIHKVDFVPEVVYLYQFCRTGFLPSISVPCLKLETWLRINGIKYENVDHKMKLRSKKGQLPFVELNGAQIADSTIIIRELSKHFNRDLDSNLTSDQRITSHALISMLENHTKWVFYWWRFHNAGQFITESKLNVRQALQTRIPTGIIHFFLKMKLRSKRSLINGMGLGVHSPEEIYDFGNRDLARLNELLGDKPYFFGDEPTLLDAVAFAVILQFQFGQGDKFPPKVFIEEKCPQLVALVERIKQRYWPDWQEMIDTLDLNTHLPKPVPPPAAKKEEEDEKKEKETGKEDEKEGEKEKGEKDEKERDKKDGKLEESDNKFEEEKNKEEEAPEKK